MKIWLVICATIQAFGSLFGILGYLGITAEKLKMPAAGNPWLLVISLGLLVGSALTFSYAVRQRLVIHRAMYGSDFGGQDVTEKVRFQVHDGAANFVVGSFLFGDPRPNELKYLTVDYSYRGKRDKKITPQDNWCNLP